LLPGVELGFVNAVNRERIFADQRDVLNFFKGRKGVGRVLFDYFVDPKRFLPATPHYMSSNLFKDSGLETINGLFIQSSVAYQFPITMAVALGLDHYTAPLPFADPDGIETADAIKRLLNFGVTHIVSTEGPHLEPLGPFLDGQIVRYGPYVILPLKGGEFSPVTTVTGPVVGYLDQSGTLPFRLMEYFFYENADLLNSFEIIHLSDAADLPSGVSLLLVNGDIHEAEEIARHNPKLEVVAINFVPSKAMNHYNVRYNFHRGTEDYAEAKPYLQQILKTTLKPSLDRLISSVNMSENPNEPRLRWSDTDQEFDLDGLEPRKMVRINYSYFPFWNSSDGVLYRGGAERMIFFPKGRSAHFSYSRWQVTASWWGMGATVASVILLFLL
jgi:hypothetical protein